MTAPGPDRLTLRGEFQEQVTDRAFEAIGGSPLRLGRLPRRPDMPSQYGSDLVFPADDHISNHHAQLAWDGGGLQVARREGTSDVLFLDPPAGPAAAGRVPVGGRFRIGRTTFTLLPAAAPVERVRTADQLQAVPLAGGRGEVAALAGLVDAGRAAGGPTPDALLAAVLAGIGPADLAAVVARPAGGPATVLHVRHRAGTPDWQPSRTLVERAARGFEAVGYVWPPAGGDPADGQATRTPWLDWAACVRLPGAADAVLYFAGREVAKDGTGGRPGDELDEHLRFAQLAADVYAGQGQLRAADAQNQHLRRFVPQPVRAAVRAAGTSPEQATAARPAAVTVLFCDLRGFTPAVERGADDLPATWGRLSIALNTMTSAIVQAGGLVGDFQGDAVMAFWGWPTPTGPADPARLAEQVRRAAEAALAIRRQFVGLLDQPDHPLAELCRAGQAVPIGIGLAHGPALAGALGNAEQLKFGVFGPVVNQAARLEAATKRLRVPILVGQEVFASLEADGQFRTRPVGRFQLQGSAAGRRVGELLPAEDDPLPNLSEDDRRRFTSALDRFEARDWDGFLRISAPLATDGPTDYLRRYVQATGRPPADWTGSVPVEK